MNEGSEADLITLGSAAAIFMVGDCDSCNLQYSSLGLIISDLQQLKIKILRAAGCRPLFCAPTVMPTTAKHILYGPLRARCRSTTCDESFNSVTIRNLCVLAAADELVANVFKGPI